MPLFICRWQNGDFSAASAQSREEAVELLAEVGNAESCVLFPIDNFMVLFHTRSDADNFEEMLPVKLGGFGEQTYRMLCERMYPAYCAAISEIDKDRPNVDDVLKEKLYAARELLSNALRIERDRTVRQTPAAIGPQIRGRQDS
jgi:hypothetical protein